MGRYRQVFALMPRGTNTFARRCFQYEYMAKKKKTVNSEAVGWSTKKTDIEGTVA
jgi:hypothetical protein